MFAEYEAAHTNGSNTWWTSVKETMGFKSFTVKDWHRLMSGAIAGGVATWAAYPIDTVKVRMQVAKDATGVSMWGVMRDMVRNEGYVVPFMRGVMPPTLIRMVTSALGFCVNGYVKDMEIARLLRRAKQFPSTVKLVLNKEGQVILPMSSIFVNGTISGALMSVFVSPIEVIKVQLQTDRMNAMQSSAAENGGGASMGMMQRYRNLSHCIETVWKNRAFGRGV